MYTDSSRYFKVGLLQVGVYDSRQAAGQSAGAEAASHIKELLTTQPEVRIIFAAAPSQQEMLEALAADPGIDWSRITAFHMDEYIGLPEEAEQRFGRFLTDRLFRRVRPGKVHLINSANDIGHEAGRYASLLAEGPIDVVCLGIGENGHIAFNDPPVADFNDPHAVKTVELDAECRMQQVNDGCFERLEHVPTHALTLTIPTLMSGRRLFCVVPGATKRRAVMRTLLGGIETACPSSILRRHPSCMLYADDDSFDWEQWKAQLGQR